MVYEKNVLKALIVSAIALPATVPAAAQIYMMGRQDKTDVVYTVNEPNGQFKTQHKADLKGGKWSWLMTDDRCPGMVSVWYASNGAERSYFIETGGATERDVSLKASETARAYAKRQGQGWHAGVMRAFKNENRAVASPTGVKERVENAVKEPCAKWNPGSIGVRG